MFKITDGKGFHLTFPNGWTVSVQFGYENYCDNYLNRSAERSEVISSNTAEIAAWGPDGVWYAFSNDGDEVSGHQTAEQVLAFCNEIAAK